MPATTYDYSISKDFPNHAVAPDRLTQEIRQSAIITALDHMDTANDTCSIQFKDSLSDTDKSILDGIVAVHSGEPLPTSAQPVTLSGVPTDSDGKPQMIPNLLPSWTSLYFTGQGDDRALGIGLGQAFVCTSDVGGDSIVEWIFTDEVYLVGGSVVFTGANIGDTMDYTVVAPATPTGSGTTKVTKVAYGSGNVLVANASGADVIDLTNCSLVPSPKQGYWDWDEPETGWGTITPNYEGKGNYSMFDFEVLLGHPLVHLHVLGTGKMEFIMSNITPMRVIPSWKHRAVVHNSGHDSLKLAWMFLGGRGGAI